MALLTAAGLVAVHQPKDDPRRPTGVAELDTTTPLPCAGRQQASLCTGREESGAAKMLRQREVQKRTGLSRSTIWRMERAGQFPKSIKLGNRAVGWRESEIEKWVVSRSLEIACEVTGKTIKLGSAETW